MEFSYKLRRLRRTRNASSPSETYHYKNWRRFEKLKHSIKSKSHHSRIYLVISIAVILNLLPYIFFEYTSYTLFRFDLIGTFFIAFLAGVNVAILASIVSAVAISLIPNQEYYWINLIPNIFCATLWSILPRMGWTFLGSDILRRRKIFGYRYFVSHIALYAFVAAVFSMIFTILINRQIFEISFNSTHPHLTVFNSSNLINQSKISSPLISFFGNVGGLGQNYFYYLVLPLLALDIVSYIIQICIAMTIIYLLFEWPHFRNQNERLLDRHEKDSQWWNRNYLSGIASLLSLMIIYNLDIDFLSKPILVIFVILLFLLTKYKSPVHTRSIDPYRRHGSRKGLFINSNTGGNLRDERYKLPYFRDGVEDLLKLSTILISMISALSLILLRDVSEKTLGIYINSEPVLLSDVSTIFAFNVLAITGIRYSLVIFLRIFDKS